MNDKCPEAGLLAGYALDDGISAAQRETVARHAAGCPACRREIDSLRAALGLVASRVDRTAAPDLRDRVMAQLANRQALAFFPRRAWLPALAAAALLFALIGHALRPAVTDAPVTVAAAPGPAVAGQADDFSFTATELDEIFEAEDLALWGEMDELALAMDEAAIVAEDDEV